MQCSPGARPRVPETGVGSGVSFLLLPTVLTFCYTGTSLHFAQGAIISLKFRDDVPLLLKAFNMKKAAHFAQHQQVLPFYLH